MASLTNFVTIKNMRKAIKYCYVAVLMSLVYYYVSFLFIVIPSTSTLNRTINIVTDTVKTVRNCDKYIVPFILNGKFSQYTETFSLN